MGSGEEAGSVLSDAQQAALTAICDTVVPPLERGRDPEGLWALQGERSGSRPGRGPADFGDPRPGAARGPPDPDRRNRRTGHHPGAFAGVPRADPEEHGSLRSASRGGRGRVDRHDPLPSLRRAGPADRSEPELADVPLSRPDLGAAAGGEAAADPRAGGLGGDHRGRRLRGRLRLRWRRRRGGAGGARPAGGRARGGRLLQRIGLRPARAQGLPGDVLAWRPHADG